jgi:hypothetical protein
MTKEKTKRIVEVHYIDIDIAPLRILEMRNKGFILFSRKDYVKRSRLVFKWKKVKL